MINRRSFLRNSAACGALLASQGLLPPWARSAQAATRYGLSGNWFDLVIGRTDVAIDGRRGKAITVNGTLPAPLLRWREGEEVTLRVTNSLREDSSIHWHGILIPFQMDGVPGVSFPGIKPGETFTYRFPVRQSGTYWYHSHSGLQEQVGHYGPIIIDPAGADPVAYDREYVLVLSDWTFLDPHRLFAKLKKEGDSLNFQKRDAGEFVQDTRKNGLFATLKDRMMWGQMRMSPTDILDVTGATYTYLVNGHGPADNWTALFRPGERVRLRLINASAMTIFNIRIPGLPMTVVQSDGQNVVPLETDEFQIGVAETYDIVVRPPSDRAFTLMAESIDRSGYARATLAPRPGMEAAIPPLRERPTLTMKDMGMGHGEMGHGEMGQGGMDHGSMDHGSMDHGGMNHATGDMGEMQMGSMGGMNAPQIRKGPGVANIAMAPQSRLDEPGIGLENVPHRALAYSQLRSLAPNPDPRPPGRELVIHLTSNMDRYMWSFDGVKFSDVVDPIVFHEGERLRLTMVNDTMMPHPIHLHGMFFELVNGGGRHCPRKHTVIVKPGEKLSVDITADAVGDWAFHCHFLYHMHAGMMQVVSVRPGHGGARTVSPGPGVMPQMGAMPQMEAPMPGHDMSGHHHMEDM
ncbi:copper resistance system multicopper oxidase [Methyloligella sp. 2.7D]|uniref:copper resistance system multicopper oxidase n=1 Tax=unclassified Methyloligella TaxID=2625955 RepID=UPI00157C5FE5|nr:copper resistance system multicopper oxidase [Methyloligella sp. GL2]QKP76705.1 copper resistance system multicopper oxidase [Methyloligella sp. GL2]